VRDTFFLQDRIDVAGPVHEEDVIGAECGIDEEFPAPVPFLMLQSENVLLRAANRFG
jgi:hypothetical protein